MIITLREKWTVQVKRENGGVGRPGNGKDQEKETQVEEEKVLL